MFPRSTRNLILSLGCVLAALVAPAHAQPAETVRIGFASPLTGPQAHYGQDNLNGARMAIEELNAQKFRIRGQVVRFELVIEDDQADPRTGTVVAQRLVDAGIRGMAGHFNSGVSIPASKIYSDAGIPQLSVSTAVRYTRQGHRTAFRMMADDDQQGAVLGRYATGALKLKRLAVVDDRTAYGQGLADAFSAAVNAAGGQVVKREYTTDKEFDFRAILVSIRSASPGAIFFAGYDAQAESSDPAKVLPALRAIKHPGVTAEIEFDANGDLKHGSLSIFRVTGGKWVL